MNQQKMFTGVLTTVLTFIVLTVTLGNPLNRYKDYYRYQKIKHEKHHQLCMQGLEQSNSDHK